MWGARLCHLAAAVAVGVLLAGTAAAQETCNPPVLATGERPDPEGIPTRVSVAFLVLDVMGVDDADQQIDIDLRQTMQWRDPRLVGLSGCRLMVTQVWFPQLTLVNSSELRTTFQQARDQVVIGDDGAVTYVQRYTGQISTYHDLHRFPFDAQAFGLEFVVPNRSRAEVILIPDDANSHLSPRLNIEGWNIQGIGLTETAREAHMLDRDVSLLTLTINAKRIPIYYVYRVFLPLLLVVAMSWIVFWVPVGKLEFQIGLGATAMLTTIAFTLSISSKLPDLSYLTILDKMLIWALSLVFLSMVEALMTGLLAASGRDRSARRLDLASRALFPLLLAAGWAAIMY